MMQRRGSRALIVEGQSYRWRLRHKPADAQNLSAGGLLVAVEAEHEETTRLLLRFPLAGPDKRLSAPPLSLSPRDISLWIRRARRAGWRPLEEGAPFDLFSRYLEQMKATRCLDWQAAYTRAEALARAISAATGARCEPQPAMGNHLCEIYLPRELLKEPYHVSVRVSCYGALVTLYDDESPVLDEVRETLEVLLGPRYLPTMALALSCDSPRRAPGYESWGMLLFDY